MALTGLQIQKLLPKTNCKECGSNTCLAFAMKLAAKKIDLAECPYASEEAKQILGAASEPPVKGIALGPEKKLKLGEETVLYRHEKTFVNQTAIAININDNDDEKSINEKIEEIKNYSFERVGEVIKIDMISVTDKSNDADLFCKTVEKVYKETSLPLVLRSDNTDNLIKAADVVKGSNSVLSAADNSNCDKLKEAASANGHALAVTGTMDEISGMTEKLKSSGFNDLILQFKTNSMQEQFAANSISRIIALKKDYKQLGYPGLYFVKADNIMEGTSEAINEINKYGSICVFPNFDRAQISTLFTARMNIYTDPQKPIQVEPKLYPIGEPKEDSPVFVTTNFSLTYFIVSGEIENSGISAWLLIPQCEGMSVLTAWAAGKFSGAHIAKFAQEIDLDNHVRTRDIIIPGYVSQISGDLEENMKGWNVIVGPQEAADLESFISAKLS